jgi:hypothetical protein
VQYSDESGSGRLGQVDGDTFTLIANPGENMRGYEVIQLFIKTFYISVSQTKQMLLN